MRQKHDCLQCPSARERRDSGTRAGPGRDPDGTRAGPGRDPGDTRAHRGAQPRPDRATRGTLRAAEAACGHSSTLEPLAGALQGTRGARNGPWVRPKAPSHSCNGARSLCARVLAGSRPGPARGPARWEKWRVVRAPSCIEALKRPNTDEESHLVSLVHPAAVAQAPQTPLSTRRDFLGCAVWFSGAFRTA